MNYRVRHKSHPELYVWYAEKHEVEGSFGAKNALLKVYFTDNRSPMSEEEAQQLADDSGGYLEDCGVFHADE